MDDIERLMLWTAIGLMAAVSIVHSRILGKLVDQKVYDLEFSKIAARESEGTDD